jgi:hypothetical protein
VTFAKAARALVMAASALPVAAWAEGVFVDWTAKSGSLPPPYAWSVTVRIMDSGTLSLTRCSGYATEGADCTTHRALVPAHSLGAIRAAVAGAGLAERPLREMEMFPVGGSTVMAVIATEAGPVVVPPFPVEDDAERAGLVLRAIYDAIPRPLAQALIEAD